MEPLPSSTTDANLALANRADQSALSALVGGSVEMQAVRELMTCAAPTLATVLVIGEAGTGKDLIAQTLHALSPRHARPFIKVGCASFTTVSDIDKNVCERADTGTSFLDDIGALGEASQDHLLAVLRRHRADVRVIAATKLDLSAEVKVGRFREDLFFRLSAISLMIPPLRLRKADIPDLAAHFIEKYSRDHGKRVWQLAPRALDSLLAHAWPGNVRELESVIEGAVVLSKGTCIESVELPALAYIAATERELPQPASLRDIERQAILAALRRAGGSTRRAAAYLGISVRTVQYRLRSYAAQD